MTSTLTFNHTLLAYFLSLSDYPQSLLSPDQENLQAFATQCNTYKNRLQESEAQAALIKMLTEKIAENPQLNQLFETYKNQLSLLGEIPDELLPTWNDVYELETSLKGEKATESRSGDPNIKDDKTPEGQAKLLNNFAILLLESKEPEKVTKNLKWIDKLKEWLVKLMSS